MKLHEILCVLNEGAQASTIMHNLLVAKLHRVMQLLVAGMHTRLDAVERGTLIAAYESLNRRTQARLLTSAEFAEIVQMNRGTSTEVSGGQEGLTDATWRDAVASCITRERWIECAAAGDGASAALGTSGRVWSTLGDVYAWQMPDRKWTVRSQPIIGEVIALDFDSPLALRTELRSGVLSWPRQELQDAEKLAVQKKLNNALALIDELVPTYGLLIRNFTRQIIIRKHVTAGGRHPISSEHVPRQPGAIRLLNFQCESESIESCAEHLLHESVHNMVAAWEMTNTNFFVSNDRYRPVSPWSGNQIPNPSLAHAIFVYYACHHLFDVHWKRGQLGSGREDDVAYRRNVFASGFLIDQKLSELFLDNDCGTGELFPIITSMQKSVRRYHLRAPALP